MTSTTASRTHRLLLVPFLSLCLLLPGCGSSRFQGPEEAAESLRTAYHQMDYARGAAVARAEARYYPDDLRVQAWSLYLRGADGEREWAVGEAERLLKAHPEEAMAWLATALTRGVDSGDNEGAVEASTKALDLAPGDPDVIWAHANLLQRKGDYAEALAFVDAHLSGYEDKADLYVVKALLHRALSYDKTHDRAAEVAASYAALQEARSCDPSRVRAAYYEASYLVGDRRTEEALPIIRAALEQAPDVVNLHTQLWRTITASSDLSPAEKKEQVLADMEPFLVRKGGRPEVLSSVASGYESLDMDEERAAIQQRILADFPRSSQAEWVLVDGWRSLSSEAGGLDKMEAEQKASYRKVLEDFIARGEWVNESLAGEAYRDLFYVLRDEDAASEEGLLATVRGMVAYEHMNPTTVYGTGPAVLAEKTAYYDEAEQIAKQGFDEVRKQVEGQRSFYEEEADYQRALDTTEGIVRDALGWVYFNAGREDQAEKELLAAHDLYPKNLTNLHHLGRLYETSGRMEEAEKYYMTGAGIATPGENPNLAALKALYEASNGGTEGWETYLGSLDEIDRARRKKEVLEARITTPEAAPAFSLRDLVGRSVSLESLEGKVVVVNYWGIWCGWCVLEMPEFQQLHEQYAGDPDVVILTINNDTDPDDVPPWMAEKGYDYRVLLDDGYVTAKAQITAFPTSWFLDTRGRIAFEKVGWSEKLLEEFSWRIEALKGGK